MSIPPNIVLIIIFLKISALSSISGIKRDGSEAFTDAPLFHEIILAVEQWTYQNDLALFLLTRSVDRCCYLFCFVFSSRGIGEFFSIRCLRFCFEIMFNPQG